MTVRTMSDKELERLQILHALAEHRIRRKDAAAQMQMSVRQVNRLQQRYAQAGIEGLVSGKRGKPSNRRYPAAFQEYVLYLVTRQYADFGPTLAAEKLKERDGVVVGVETLRQWMVQAGLWLSRPERHRQQLHQPRHRRDCYGELIQIDGSDHDWFEGRGPRCTLLVFIDDATGCLMQLRFAQSESTFDYFHATRGYLERHGKPVAFYSDKHAIFRVNKAGAVSGNGMTQFGRALYELNIDILCANSSQAKGRVERVNRTLQDRLIKELRLRGIHDIAAGNAYLPAFAQAFNAKFERSARNPTNVHRPLTDADDLERILCWQEQRTVTNSLTVQYDRVVYLLDPGSTPLELRRQKVTVYDFPDGTIEITYNGYPLRFTAFDKVRQVRQADIVTNKRLSSVLRWVQERQQINAVQRSQKAPVRHGQQQAVRERQLNPAAWPPG